MSVELFSEETLRMLREWERHFAIIEARFCNDPSAALVVADARKGQRDFSELADAVIRHRQRVAGTAQALRQLPTYYGATQRPKVHLDDVLALLVTVRRDLNAHGYVANCQTCRDTGTYDARPCLECAGRAVVVTEGIG